MQSLVTALFVILIVVLPAGADSDGYYCAAPGYLAVEFRSFSTPSINGTHVLKILHFDEERGPRWTGEVAAEDFQAHTLTCGEKQIILEGIGDSRRGLVSYAIELDPDGWPRIISVRNDPSYVFVARKEPPNLGLWAKPGVTLLPGGSPSHHFQLRVTESVSGQSHEILHHKRTVIEELDGSGKVLRSLQLTEGTQVESVD
jgi:hypothetical protein